jgi:hypothetical protein
MRIGKFIGAVTAAAMTITPVVVSAQPVGSLVSVSGDAFLSHDGRLVRAQPSMSVEAGDRVITRSGATANVSLDGCSVGVAGGEMKTFGGDSCGSVQSASFTRAADGSANGQQLLGGAGIIIAILAAAAVIAGVVVIATDNSSNPTSP